MKTLWRILDYLFQMNSVQMYGFSEIIMIYLFSIAVGVNDWMFFLK